MLDIDRSSYHLPDPHIRLIFPILIASNLRLIDFIPPFTINRHRNVSTVYQESSQKRNQNAIVLAPRVITALNSTPINQSKSSHLKHSARKSPTPSARTPAKKHLRSEQTEGSTRFASLKRLTAFSYRTNTKQTPIRLPSPLSQSLP